MGTNSVSGEQLVRVDGNGLHATVAPRRGAKIVSLTDRAGQEWLLQPGAPAPSGTPFTAAETGGWDECAPTIVPCTSPEGTALPDHGDLWDTPWSADGSSMTAHGTALDYTITRTIVPCDQGLRLEYTVTARCDTPFLWAAHPQFSAPPEARVRFETGQVIDALDAPGAPVAWHESFRTIDSLGPGTCRKVYSDPGTPAGYAALEVPGKGRLSLRWDADTCPYLGIWFDNRAYARAPVIGLEPSTGYYDSLAHAVGNGRVLWLERHRPVRWWVEITVETPDTAPRTAATTEA